MSDSYSSASESSELFQAALVRFRKLSDYAAALTGRFRECLEAVQSLEKHERSKAIVKELVMLNDKRFVVMTKRAAALRELITCAKAAPDYVTKGVNISQLEQAHSESIEGFKQVLPGLKALEAQFSKL